MGLNDTIRRLILSRYDRIRTGLCHGFDESLLEELKVLRGGVWVSAEAGLLPYDDNQFEVVVLNGELLAIESVREAHRVLLPGGCLFFAVPERTSKQTGYELPDIYKLVREGFDIVSLVRPSWWKVFSGGTRMLTVCAQRKNWREMKIRK